MQVSSRVCTAFFCIWSATTALAAAVDSQPSRLEVEEVIVTAERRESALEKTPLAVSVFDQSFLEEGSIRSIQDLANYAPGLTYTQVSNFVQLNVRGIGLEQINLGGEPGVAFHQDGVYIGRPFVNDAIFTDVARVEVMRGPQGTLYGRNATGGSINVVPNRPTDTFEGTVSMTLGNYDLIRTTAVASGPMTEPGSARGRVAFVAEDRDGYLHNRLDDNELEDRGAYSTRGELAIDVSDSLSISLIGDYMKEEDGGPVLRVGSILGTAAALGGRTTSDPWDIYQDGPDDQDITAWGTALRISWDIGDANVTSLTARRDNSFRLQSDLDGTDFTFLNEDLSEDAQQFSQEIQISSTGDGKLEWLVGGQYFSEDGDLDYIFDVPILATTIRFVAHQETTAYAIFGQLKYAVTDRLSVTGGLRYSDEEKEGETTQTFFVTGNVSVDDGWNAFSPRFVVDYQIDDEKLAYFSVARGFKTGGINTGSLQTAMYDPEYIWNYELGLKARWFGGRVQTNVAAFYYDYDDLQVTQFAVGQTFIENAASAEGQGVELELAALLSERFSINASIAYLDTEFTDYDTVDTFRPTLGELDLSGNQLPRAPEWSGNVIARYDFPLAGDSRLSVQAEYQHKDEMYFTPFNTGYAQGGDFDLVNGRIAFESAGGRWEVALFGRNLTDEAYEQTITVSGINGGTLVLYGAPLTYGVEAKYRME